MEMLFAIGISLTGVALLPSFKRDERHAPSGIARLEILRQAQDDGFLKER